MLAICLVLLLMIRARFTIIAPVQASTQEGDGSDESGNDGSEGDSNESDDTEVEEGEESDSPPPAETNPGCGSGDCEAVEPEEPGNDSDNNDREPLPCCGNEAEGQSCHDIDDVDEVTGKYPCNDGSQRANKADCPDATKPVLPTQPNVGTSKNIVFTKYIVVGSGLPEQTGPPPVPKEGEALLKVIYEGEWSGNILDSNFDSASYDGSGNYAIVFPCETSGMYSLTTQKMDEGNDPMQLIVQNHLNQTLDNGQTTAEFGLVSLSGDC